MSAQRKLSRNLWSIEHRPPSVQRFRWNNIPNQSYSWWGEATGTGRHTFGPFPNILLTPIWMLCAMDVHVLQHFARMIKYATCPPCVFVFPVPAVMWPTLSSRHQHTGNICPSLCLLAAHSGVGPFSQQTVPKWKKGLSGPALRSTVPFSLSPFCSDFVCVCVC